MVKSLDTIRYNLSLLDKLNHKVNTALSSKEALEYGSDDSVLYSKILGIKNDINMYTGIQEHITLSDPFNRTSDDTMKAVKEFTDSIIYRLSTANSDTIEQDEREIIAQQFMNDLDSLFALANTQVDGQYIFAGVNTDTIPFSKDPVTGVISYNSDNSTRKVNVEDKTYAPQGINGIEAFYYVNNEVSSGEKFVFGDTFTFDSTESIVDEDGNPWQIMDTNSDGLYDSMYINGDTSTTPIAVTDNADGTVTVTNTSSTILDRSGDGDTFTFTTNDIILDKDGNEWQLLDTNSDGTYDGLYINGDTTTTPINVTDNGDGTITATNTSFFDLEVHHSVFDDLSNVINALNLEDKDGNEISRSQQKTVIEDVSNRIKLAYDSQNIAHSLVGTRTSAIESYGEIVSTKMTNLNALDIKYSTPNLTELAIQSKSLEITYASLYSTITRINELSLVNYMR